MRGQMMQDKFKKEKTVGKRLTDKKFTEKKLADKKPVDKKTFEKKAVEKAGAEKKFGDKNGAEKRAAEKKTLDKKNFPKGQFCPHFTKCGSCKYLDKTYAEQLSVKEQYVADLMKKYCKCQPIIGMDDPFHYRHKVHAVFGLDRKKNPISGVYEERSHRILPVDSCLIEDQKADAIVGTIRDLLKSFKIKVYDEDTGYGLLRYVLVRKGYATGEIMVVLVTSSPVFPSKKNFVDALRKVHPEVTTVVQNVNDRTDSMILGAKSQVIYGKGYIVDELCGCSFKISPASFYQVNPEQAQKLYNKAIELADLIGKEMVVDAYCGTGTIGIIASQKAGEVIGVELNKDAVRDAVNNAKANGRSNIRFYQDDASHFLMSCAADGVRADVLLMDPPRAGSTEVFMDAAVVMQPEKIVYVSCNPETLARDVAYLEKKGYKAKEVWPVDMFPWTEHCETVVLLSREKADDHIRFSINTEDLKKNVGGYATYGDIKAYVLEKFGLKVSSLYIAQTKDKCGIKERENYYIGEGKSKELICPPEKEKAIMDAFRHFGMLKD